MMKLLEKLRKREEATIEQAHKAYRNLVAKLADDVSVTEEQAADICERAGKSVDDLESDVTRLTERKRLATILAGKLDAEKQRAKVAADITTEVERFQKIEAEHDQKIQALDWAVRQADERIAESDAACRDLIEGANNPDLLAERDALAEKVASLEAERAAVRAKIGHLESALSTNLRRAEGLGGEGAAAEAKRQQAEIKSLTDRQRELVVAIQQAADAVRQFERERLTAPDA